MTSMNTAALYHRAGLEYRYFADGAVYIRLQTAARDMDSVALFHGLRYDHANPPATTRIDMQKNLSDGVHDWYEASFKPADPRICYYFRLSKGSEEALLLDCGVRLAVPENRNEWFFFPYVQTGWEHDVPCWARGATVYQIFVDRFAHNGESAGFEPWGGKPRGQHERFGGNLAGILERVPYLKELGIDILYLTPIFTAHTNHRYDTVDYYKVDPEVGTNEELRMLADELHACGMHIVIDGVFNHCSPDFFAFRDVMERGKDSPYKDWFGIKGYPVSVQRGCYEAFADVPGLPRLNMANPAVQEYLCEVGKYWLMECEVDGWRMDVVNEIDPGFLRRFRQAVHEVRPDTLLVGEIWTDAFEWLGGDMLDSVMNYPVIYPLWEGIAKNVIDVREFDRRMNRALSLYTHPVQQAGWTMIGTHDTERFLHMAGGDVRRLRAAAFVQFTCPGSPLIYYGDELAMDGGHDPDCRRCMTWQEATDGSETLYFYRRLAQLRKALPALRLGCFRTYRVEDSGVYAYVRETECQTILVVINLSENAIQCHMPLPDRMSTPTERFGNTQTVIANGFVEMTLEAWAAAILV